LVAAENAIASPEMTKKKSSAGIQHALPACRLVNLTAIWAVFFALGLQPPAFADETDEGNSTSASERQIADRELQLAHETVEKARSATVSAKMQLDDFIARHFDEHHLRGASPLPKFRGSQPARKSAANPRWQQLNDQLTELKTRREDLLNRLMPVHPDVMEVDDQIAVLSRRLALERLPAEAPAPPGAAEGVDAADGDLAEYLSSERQRHQQSASAYAEILARWQAAERDLHAALEGERQAAQRLAEIKAPIVPMAAMPSPTVTSLPMPAPSASGHASKAPRQGSQPLALAVLLIALAVAALAAIKLARSSTDAVFANAAEVSAVLAVPVVGIIPAAEMASYELTGGSRFRRGTQFLAEILLALAVFVAVAYVVQNPLFIWQICTDPMDGLSRMARFFRAN
jgi:hypothetical protein